MSDLYTQELGLRCSTLVDVRQSEPNGLNVSFDCLNVRLQKQAPKHFRSCTHQRHRVSVTGHSEQRSSAFYDQGRNAQGLNAATKA